MNKFVFALAVWSALAAPAAPSASPADDPRAVLTAHEAKRKTEADEYVGELSITAKNGTVRKKEWKSYHQGSGASSNRLIRFLSPPDVRGVGYLRRQRTPTTFDEWLYLPSMGRERRVVQSDRQAAFVGTDFSYEDLEDLEVLNQADYDVAMLAERVIDGHPCYAIDLHPRVRSEYSRKVAVIRKDNLALLVLEYYRKTEKTLSKQLALSDYHEIDRHDIALFVDMTDLRKGSHTSLRLRSVALDRPQPADRYTIQNLNREEDASLALPIPMTRSVFGNGTNGWMPSTSDPRRPPVSVTASGYMEARLVGYLGRSTGKDSWTDEWGDLFLKASARFGQARLNTSIRAEASSILEGPIAFDPADRSPLRSPLSLREFSLALPIVHGLDVQAGRFPVAWSDSERLSPLDAFLPRDLTDPLGEERLPLWGLQMRGEWSGVRVEVLATPTTTPWRLPVLDGRHSPVSSQHTFLVEQASPIPKRGFESVRVSDTIGAWDVGVWARTGVRPAPIIEPHEDRETIAGGNTIVPFTTRYTSETAGGVHVSHPWQGWLIEGEIGVLRSADADLGNAVIVSIVGTHPVRNGEFLATFAFNGIKPPVDPLLLFDRSLLPAFILGVKQTETWGTWRAGWVAVFNRVGGVLTGEVVKNVTDVVKLTLGADLPHGDAFSAARAFAGDKRLRAGIRWEW